MRLSYLGPPGTFSEEAAVLFLPDAELVPFPTITASARAVLTGEADAAVAPVENSLQGAVTETLDLLIHGEGLHISHELAIDVVHNLMAAPGVAIGDVKRVYSHPQALGQCMGYIEHHLPGAEVAAAISTAGAVEQAMAADVPAAAIAPRRAADLYGATLLAQGIQDDDNNMTRFVVLAPEDSAATGDDKTSVCFSFNQDRPGLLFGVMERFAEAGINLAKVESRPTRMGLGRYYFLIDLDGHRTEPKVAAVLESVKERVSEFKIFGSYPKYAPEG